MQQTFAQNDDVKTKAPPLRAYWGCHDSPLGPVLLAVNEENGLCRLEFASGYGLSYDLMEWKKQWPDTDFVPDAERTAHYASQFSHMNVQGWGFSSVALYGRAFPLKIWKAMLEAKGSRMADFADVVSRLPHMEAA